MSVDLPIRCECGTLRGVASGLSEGVVTRVVCYCRDCQAFAHFLNRADSVLDAHGGTDICQVSPRTVRFEAGAEQLACVRLTPKGPYRWFSSCCQSPVANTVAGLAVAGFIRPTVQPDEVGLKTINGRIFACDAIGDRATLKASKKIPLPLLGRVLRKLTLRRIRGDHRHSPFHDHAIGLAAAKPLVLSEDERAALEKTRLAWQGHAGSNSKSPDPQA